MPDIYEEFAKRHAKELEKRRETLKGAWEAFKGGLPAFTPSPYYTETPSVTKTTPSTAIPTATPRTALPTATPKTTVATKKTIPKTKGIKMPLTSPIDTTPRVITPDVARQQAALRGHPYTDTETPLPPTESLGYVPGGGLPYLGETPTPTKPETFRISPDVRDMMKKIDVLMEKGTSDVGSLFGFKRRRGRAELGMAKYLSDIAGTMVGAEAGAYKEPEVYKAELEAQLKKPEMIKTLEEAETLKARRGLLPLEQLEEQARIGEIEAKTAKERAETRIIPETSKEFYEREIEKAQAGKIYKDPNEKYVLEVMREINAIRTATIPEPEKAKKITDILNTARRIVPDIDRYFGGATTTTGRVPTLKEYVDEARRLGNVNATEADVEKFLKDNNIPYTK